MTPVLDAQHIRKSFGNVQALKDASFTMQPGEVTALIGDNGAGKSTLVRCICGIHAPDAGTVHVQGEPVRFSNPEQARDAGIETVHQNLALVEDLTVWQNLFLTREETRGFGPIQLMNRRSMASRATDMVSTLAINVPSVKSRVRRLSGGQRQAVAIARAAGWGSSIVIMDEPTAALGVQETAKVEELIHDLKSRGISIMLISHNFDQVLRLADAVTVMRAGRTVATRRGADTHGDELVGLVTGAVAPDAEFI
ncbi:MAG: ATP-binding cassette domain-containing protein [Candidatus Nanopelagicales bacterium]